MVLQSLQLIIYNLEYQNTLLSSLKINYIQYVNLFPVIGFKQQICVLMISHHSPYMQAHRIYNIK